MHQFVSLHANLAGGGWLSVVRIEDFVGDLPWLFCPRELGTGRGSDQVQLVRATNGGLQPGEEIAFGKLERPPRSTRLTSQTTERDRVPRQSWCG